MDQDIFEDRRNRQYWIDRKGVAHRHEGEYDPEFVSFHAEIAALILPGEQFPQDILMRRGWVVVGSVSYHCPIINREPTQRQIDKLAELGLLEHLRMRIGSQYIVYM